MRTATAISFTCSGCGRIPYRMELNCFCYVLLFSPQLIGLVQLGSIVIPAPGRSWQAHQMSWDKAWQTVPNMWCHAIYQKFSINYYSEQMYQTTSWGSGSRDLREAKLSAFWHPFWHQKPTWIFKLKQYSSNIIGYWMNMEVFNMCSILNTDFHSCIFEHVEELMCGYIETHKKVQHHMSAWCNDIQLLVSLSSS